MHHYHNKCDNALNYRDIRISIIVQPSSYIAPDDYWKSIETCGIIFLSDTSQVNIENTQTISHYNFTL